MLHEGRLPPSCYRSPTRAHPPLNGHSLRARVLRPLRRGNSRLRILRARDCGFGQQVCREEETTRDVGTTALPMTDATINEYWPGVIIPWFRP